MYILDKYKIRKAFARRGSYSLTELKRKIASVE
jgi:hypothetical protein